MIVIKDLSLCHSSVIACATVNDTVVLAGKQLGCSGSSIILTDGRIKKQQPSGQGVASLEPPQPHVSELHFHRRAGVDLQGEQAGEGAARVIVPDF